MRLDLQKWYVLLCRTVLDTNVLLATHNLSCQIEQRSLWQNVSFSVEAGRSLGISGPSGSGKSLLFRMLVHLDPIQSGEIILHQKPLIAWDIPQLRQTMIYLPQHPATLEGSVEENLQAVFRFRVSRQGGRSLQPSRPYAQQTILDYLNHFNRDASFLQKSTHHLSGGERQILALIRALQLNPSVLLLDEPTAALDPETSQQFETLVHDWLATEQNRAYLWISHDPDQMSRMTDTQIALNQYRP